MVVHYFTADREHTAGVKCQATFCHFLCPKTLPVYTTLMTHCLVQFKTMYKSLALHPVLHAKFQANRLDINRIRPRKTSVTCKF